MKYGAPIAEMFAVVTFVEKYRAHLGSAPFTRGQQGVILIEDILDGSELYRKIDSEIRSLPHDNRAQDA